MLLFCSACNDNLSNVGGSIRPEEDALQTHEELFLLNTKTVKIDSIYNQSVFSLLGEFNDPVYGSYRASYISRFQHAPGFRFKHEPINGKIDSTFVIVDYSSWVGDSTVWSKVSAYAINHTLPESNYSTSLDPYLLNKKYLGSLVYSAGDKTGKHKLRIPISNEVGQLFYTASKEHPEFFNDRKAFEENLLRGIFLESTTGSGCMISVFSTALSIQYKYEETGKTADKTADSTWLETETETFVNTKQLYMHRSFDSKNLESLLGEHDNFGYITSPEGVALSLVLPKEAVEELNNKRSDHQNLTSMINGASLELEVEVPNNTSSILQPPPYLLLLPRDSVASFFENHNTEITRPESAFLSSQYNISTRKYAFENISLLLYKHLIDYKNSKSSEVKNLELIVLPVSREINQNITASVSNFLFPSAAKIKLKEGGLILKVISTSYRNN